jgi:hypothetical protein
MSSPDKLSVFDTAVVAFEIRFEQKLDSSWGHLAYETRMAIVGEGMEIDSHQWEKRHLLLKFFDDAAAAVAVVISEYFPLLLEVAIAQREHLGDETPLIWTRAKILTQVCDFLGVDEKFDETSAPKDDSRVLKTAERITAGLGWRDDEAPAEFCLPWWANMSPLFCLRRLALAPHNSRPRNSNSAVARYTLCVSGSTSIVLAPTGVVTVCWTSTLPGAVSPATSSLPSRQLANA